MKKNKLTICDYIAQKVPNEAFNVLKNSGYEFEEPNSKEELAQLLKNYVAMDKETALKKLAEIHPDRELIEELDREVHNADFLNQQNNMFAQGYNNPFVRTPYRVGAPNAAMYGFGGYGFDGVYANGCNCPCNHSNFDGQTQKDYTPLIVTLGIFALIYLTIKEK
jgi:hypothetical protein